MSSLEDRVRMAIDDLRDRINDLIAEEKIANCDLDVQYHNELCDLIFEIADSNVPIYTGDLMQLAADNIYLATEEPELGPAFDGSPTPVNIVAANVFEHIEGKLWEYVRDDMESDDKLNWYSLEYNSDDIYYYHLNVYVGTWGVYANHPMWLVTEPYDQDNVSMYSSFWDVFEDIVSDAHDKGMRHIEIVWHPDTRPIMGCDLPPTL